MPPPPEQVAPHMDRFLNLIDDAFRRHGVPDGLPDRLRRAVIETPRHLFVHRYRISGGPLRTHPDGGALHDGDGYLAEIYSDAVMIHVDAAGEKLPSSNSQPSYVLWLLYLLDLQPGQRVLEIGSGSGWLAAIMARLVGDSGHVTGLEMVPALAAQSRADLAGVNIGNVSVLAIEGSRGHRAGAPYDRAMITAAVWDIPTALFDQVDEGGCLLAPVELRGGGCHVAVLRRNRDGFVAERAVPGWFVPMLGPSQRRPQLRRPLTALPFWADIGDVVPRRVPLPLATGPDGSAGSAVGAFRAFLGRTAAGFAIFGHGDPPEQRSWLPAEPFGIVDEARGSTAYWRDGALFGHGDPSALQAMADAYARWTSLGLPGLTGMALTVLQAGTPAETTPMCWRDDRGSSVLVWSCERDAGAWTSLSSASDRSGAHGHAGLL